VREIRTLRAMWRALETGLRQFLNGHDEGNLGYKPRRSLRAAAPVLDPTSSSFILFPFLCLKHRHQNACHEIEQFRSNRCFYGYEFFFCSNQA